MALTYAYPGDDPAFTTSDMNKLMEPGACKILEPFVPSKHFKLEEVLQCYYAQPWMIEEAVKV